MTNPISISVEDTEVVTVQVPQEISVLTVQVPGTPGAKGNPGDKGDRGDPGTDGEDGPAGPPNVITVGTVSTLATGANATASLTGTSPNQVLNLGLPRGATGNAGPANTLVIGTVNTLPAGSSATATITGSSPNQTLNLGLPAGAAGSTGPANTLTVGTVTTLPTGSSASVTITGSAPNQTINFSIPAGPQGNAGAGAPDATSSSKGSIQLAGDLSGTASAPTVPGLANKVDSTDTRLTNARTPTAHATTHATGGSDPITPANIGAAATSHTHTSSAITDAASAATPSVVIKRDANGRAQVVDPAVAADIATKNYVDTKVPTVSDSSTTAKGVVQLAGDFGGTAAAPTVIGGTHHTHTASQISDATTVGKSLIAAVDAATARAAIGAGTGSSNLVIGTTSTTAAAGDHTHADLTNATASAVTPQTLVKRDANGNSTFNEALVYGQTTPASATRKDYVDAQVATRAATVHNHVSTDVTDLQETVRDTIGAALVAGSNITITPNDASDTITIASTGGGGGSGNVLYLGQTDTVPANTPANTVIVRPGTPYGDEQVRDAIGTALTAGYGTTITPDDTNDTITVALNSSFYRGVVNGVATLDSTGQVPAVQLGNIPTKTYVKYSNTTRASSVVLTADPDLIATSLTPGSYVIEADLRWLSGTTTGNVTWYWNGSASLNSTIRNMTWTLNSHTGAATGSLGVTDPSSAIAYTATTSATLGYFQRVNIFISVISAGSYGLYWGQNTSSATAQQLLAGSFMRVTKVG